MKRTKYTLIERAEYPPTAVPTSLLQDIRDSGEIITAERPITLAEIRAQRMRVMTEAQWKADMAYRAQAEAFDAYRTKYHGVITEAVVMSWDQLRGEGWIRLSDGSARDIYACNIPGRKTWFPETACVFYKQGETIQVKLDIHTTKTFVIGLTPGHLDTEKWNSLDQSKLAFRCNEAGEAVTGLFAPGAGL